MDSSFHGMYPQATGTRPPHGCPWIDGSFFQAPQCFLLALVIFYTALNGI
jgi:hypothetical protein